MSDRTKKILVGSLFAASVVAIATGLYFAFFRTSTPETPIGTETTDNTGSLPQSQPGGPRPGVPGGTSGTGSLGSSVARGGVTQVTTLTTGAVANAGIATNGSDAHFYNPEDGKFYTINATGAVVSLSSTTFPDAKNVAWNKDGDQAVIEFPDGTNVVYNFGTQTQTTLPSHWEDFSFSPVSNEILAKSIGIDPNNRWLVVSNADGSQVQSVAALGNNADKVLAAWSPNDQVIAFADTASTVAGAADRRTILPVGKGQENFKGLVVEGFDFTPLWSPDGKQLVYSVVGSYSDDKPLLWIVDATAASMGDHRRSLGLNTWADKCTFGSATLLYCAVPKDLPAGQGLQRSLVDRLPDTLYAIDLETGARSVVAVPASDTTMNHLTINDDGSLLYFVDGRTNRLSMIRLK